MRRAAAVLLLLIVSAPARAFFVKPQVKETLGSGQYYATAASLDVGEDLHVKPSFSTYHSATSSGTFYTGAVRVGYDWDDWGFGVTGGWSPYTNSYKNRFAGGDVWWSWDAEQSTSSKTGVSSVDLTASLLQTIHTEENTLPTRKVGLTFIPGSQTTADVAQTDLSGGAAVAAFDESLGVNLTKSVYNKDLSRIAFRAQGIQRLAGLVSTIQGFPDVNASIKLGYEGWERLKPYASYTYTDYKIAAPHSAAYTLGLYGKLDALKLDAAYERFAQAGAADINYYSLSALYKF